MEVQCIEHDLKLIFAFMRKGNVDNNLELVETMSLGAIINELQKLDNSDNNPDLSDADYELLHEIRELRNYWCHQCYIDFIYIQNDYEREREFQSIYKDLREDEARISDLYKKIEDFRIKEYEHYRR
jgi:hypothetical protein